MNNPYRVNLGQIPQKYIENPYAQEVEDEFRSDNEHLCVLVGPSGSGKTVTMTTVENSLKKQKDWIVIDLNVKGSLLEELVSKLYDTGEYVRQFLNGELDLSVWHIGGSIKENPPAASLESALAKMLSAIKDRNMKLLVCIDEVTKSEEMCRFLNSCLIYIRSDLPLYILLAGLSDDITDLKQTRNLTFLVRAHTIKAYPLNPTLIAKDYSESFSMDYDKAMEFACITKGFPTAYQTLGKILFEKKRYEIDDELLDIFDRALFDYVYKDLFFELSDKEIEYLNGGLLNHSNDLEIRKNKITYLPRFKEIFEKAIIKRELS